MNATDRRRELMALAEEINKLRILLAQEIHKLNESVSLLVNESEKLLVPSIEERERGIKPSLMATAPSGDLQYIAAAGRKRACSICGVPGHRKTTCPKAAQAYEEDRRPPAVTTHADSREWPKKKRKPMSPERKAQLAENLKKARAARKKS